MATALQVSPVQVMQPEKPPEQLIPQPERGLTLACWPCTTLGFALPSFPSASLATLFLPNPGTKWYLFWFMVSGCCISTSPGLWRLSPRLFLLVRGTSPLPPGLLRPVQRFSFGGGIVEPVTKIQHTRDGAAPSRSQRSRCTPCRAPLWFRGSLASPAPSAQLPVAMHPRHRAARPCVEDFWLQREELCSLPHPAPFSTGDEYFGA